MKKSGLFFIFVIILCFVGCTNQNNNLNGAFYSISSSYVQISNQNINEKVKSIKGATASLMDDYVKPEDRIKIDFDFYNPQLENYSLYLFPINGAKDKYKLVLYDSNEVIQELPCGKITGTPEFAFDDIYSGKDLEIFFYDEQSSEWQGILFQWDWRANDRFKENYIRIPKYDEIAACHRLGILSVINDDDSIMENTLYEASDALGFSPEIRKWILEKDTNLLTIYDCLEDKTIFEGKITFDKDNHIINEEYYQYLFLYEIPSIRDYESDGIIEVAKNPDDYDFYPDTESYPNKQEFLSHYGFDGEEPFYQCYDILDNLILELYFNKETEIGCGIRYETFYNADLEKNMKMYGFSFSSLESKKWENPKTYALQTYDGENNIKEREDIENYEETVEYRKDGRPDYFNSQGIIPWLGDDDSKEISTILDINFIYRDDGTLLYKDYSHNSFVFGTSNCSMNLYYDELQRIKYESNYITHGSIERYYIYENNGNKPSYYLMLDDNLGIYIPYFAKYE